MAQNTSEMWFNSDKIAFFFKQLQKVVQRLRDTFELR